VNVLLEPAGVEWKQTVWKSVEASPFAGFFMGDAVAKRLAMSFRIRTTASARWESRGAVGSSASMTGGRLTGPRAIATRCCSPPDNWDGMACARCCTSSAESSYGLRTNVFRELLQHCTSIKPVRLCLQLGREGSLPWMSKLDPATLPKGSDRPRVSRSAAELLVLKPRVRSTCRPRG
jgi:hypothetical protein